MSLSSANSSQHLTITAPGATALTQGAYTVGVLYRNLPSSDSFIFNTYEPANFSHMNLYFDGDMWVDFTQWDGNLDISAPHWRWLVVSKPAGVAAPKVHAAEYASSGPLSWTHAVTGGTKGNFSAINRFSIGDEFGTGFRGELACMAAYTSELSASQIELTFERSSFQFLNSGSQFLVHWPQAAGVGSLFADLAGGGIETIRTGTWTASTDPTGFDFSLGRSGKPKVWSGSVWNQHPAKVWNGSGWDVRPMAGHDGSDFVVAK